MLQKVFLVEDENDIQQIARVALEMIGGLEVEMCSSGQEALESVARFAPDLILLDVMMPGMDGVTTLQKLREIDAVRNTPVAFMTAKAQPDQVESYRALGAVDVVSKPFDPMKLAEQIREIYRQARPEAPDS